MSKSISLPWLLEDQRIFLERGYLSDNQTPEERYLEICKTIERYCLKMSTTNESIEYSQGISERFKKYIEKGWASFATPVLINFGKPDNLPISCNKSILSDSLDSIYSGLHELGMLAKNGAGTSQNFSKIRPIGSDITTGGKSNSVMDWVELYADLMSKTNQNCYKDDVEILTNEGWKLFKNLTKDETVAAVDDYNTISFVKPLDYLVSDYTGDLIKIKDSKNIDISITPNHNMVTRSRGRVNQRKSEQGKYLSNVKVLSNKLKLISAEKVNFHRDVYMNTSSYYDLGLKTELSWDEKFKIAYQADGTICSKNTTKFHFSKERKIERLIEILDNIGYKYTINKTNQDSTVIYVNSGYIPSKQLDWVDIESATLSWSNEFLDEISRWDGSRIENINNRFVYFSVDEYNIDVVQCVAAIAGKKSYKTFTDPIQTNRKRLFKLAITDRDIFGTEDLKKELEYYEGKVYCVTVPTGKIIVRSNGRTLLCGNSARRGFLTAYLSVDHPEIMDFLDIGTHRMPQDKQRFFQTITTGVTLPIGWRDDLKDNSDKKKIWGKILKTRKEIGYPYILDLTNSNEGRPQVYKDKGLEIETSNICIETSEYCNDEKTFACCLSSVNFYYFDEWKDDQNFIFDMNLMLDCVIEEYIEKGSKIKGLEKAVRFAKEHRSTGLGGLAFHSYLQKKSIPFGGLASFAVNNQIYKKLKEESDRASKWMAEHFGEPEMMKGYGYRNTTRLAQAPTKSTSFIMGGKTFNLSEGIEPHKSNYNSKKVAKTQEEVKNKELVDLLEGLGKNTKAVWDSILDNNGSVQHLSFLSEHDKEVFKTFYEISQVDVIKLAGQRQRYIDQGQSLNIIIHPDTPAKEINNLHLLAFEEGVKGLYYQYSVNAAQEFNKNFAICSNCEA